MSIWGKEEYVFLKKNGWARSMPYQGTKEGPGKNIDKVANKIDYWAFFHTHPNTGENPKTGRNWSPKFSTNWTDHAGHVHGGDIQTLDAANLKGFLNSRDGNFRGYTPGSGVRNNVLGNSNYFSPHPYYLF